MLQVSCLQEFIFCTEIFQGNVVHLCRAEARVLASVPEFVKHGRYQNRETLVHLFYLLRVVFKWDLESSSSRKAHLVSSRFLVCEQTFWGRSYPLQTFEILKRHVYSLPQEAPILEAESFLSAT